MANLYIRTLESQVKRGGRLSDGPHFDRGSFHLDSIPLSKDYCTKPKT